MPLVTVVFLAAALLAAPLAPQLARAWLGGRAQRKARRRWRHDERAAWRGLTG